MYSRIYPQKENIPPNYKGNAFDNPDTKKHCEGEDDRCGLPRKCGDESKDLSFLLSRRDGKRFELDDIILGGLIILLLNSHADDELLLILVLLFVAGL